MSEDVEVFPNAPVEEAILSFEVWMPGDAELSAAPVHDAIRETYPLVERIGEAHGGHPVPKHRPRSRSKAEESAFRFRSSDGLQVVQVTRDSVSFHRLRPYVDWEHFEAGARSVWNAFAAVCRPEAITSLRLRYLNRIRLPGSSVEVRDYFRTYIEIPPEIDVGIQDYLLRFRMMDPAIPAIADVTMRAELERRHAGIAMMFDIDVAKLGDTPTDGEPLWSCVRRLRDYKNGVFFSSITERTRELFR